MAWGDLQAVVGTERNILQIVNRFGVLAFGQMCIRIPILSGSQAQDPWYVVVEVLGEVVVLSVLTCTSSSSFAPALALYTILILPL